MKSSRRIHLVVFDLGRVMIRLCSGWPDACRRAGVEPRPGLDDPSLREPLLKLFYRNETGRLDHDGFCREAAALTGFTPEQVSAILMQWLDEPYPGWPDLLQRLRGTVATACLSNTNAEHWRLMSEGDGRHRLPLERLTYRFASHQIGAFKPEAAIYRHVERTTGMPPRAILFFDDAAMNVEGARARGWAAQTIDPAGDPVAQVTRTLEQYGVLDPPAGA